jgi:tRNA dimethylallyltransferase
VTATSKTVVVIGGPTASGKSGLALDIARRKNGAVINADSMQIYDGLPLLTAQPEAEDKEEAPHALYGALAPQDICTAARWRDMALAEIERFSAEGKLPIIVGGTGFYIKTLLQGISPIPEIAPGIREKLIARQKEMGNPAFHAALAKIDPATALKLDPFNTQRVVRAWEVLEGTGKSLAEWQSVPPVPPPAHLKFITVALLPPREILYKKLRQPFPANAAKRRACGNPGLSRKIQGRIAARECPWLRQPLPSPGRAHDFGGSRKTGRPGYKELRQAADDLVPQSVGRRYHSCGIKIG